MAALSMQEVDEVKNSWKIALPKSEEFGVQAFTRYFTKNPEVLKTILQGQTEMTEEEKSEKVKKFAKDAMDRWSEVVGALEDRAKLDEILKNRAKMYTALKVPSKAFFDFNAELEEVLETQLGFEDETKKAWARALEYTAAILTGFMEKNA